MITAHQIEMEMRIRQQQLLNEMQRERHENNAKVNAVRITGQPRVYSQFFARRFGPIVSRLQIQPA
jgi:hypothetical protein